MALAGWAPFSVAGGHEPAPLDDWRREMIPDAELRVDPRLVIYDRSEMPHAYQLSGGFHWTGYNVSGDPPDNALPNGKGGNAGVDFPWRVTGGTDDCQSIKTFTWLLLPEGKPIVWWREHMDDRLGGATGTRWLFPVGTRFGEVLLMPLGGDWVTCEMRVRERIKNDWAVDILRPFPQATDLADEIKCRWPFWAANKDLRQFVGYLEAEPWSGPERVLSDTKHPRRAVRLQASEDFLPELAPSYVYELMTKTPFRSALGVTWRGNHCYAPSNLIMPAGYRGTFIGNDQTSCASCHRTAGAAARDFDRPRGWYGHVPGNDEVFSWYPAEPASVSRNGFSAPPRIVSRPGFLEAYSPARHSPEVYHRIKRD